MQRFSSDGPDGDEVEAGDERGAAAVSVGCGMEAFVAALVKNVRYENELPHVFEGSITN
jgi:hypothetical protein